MCERSYSLILTAFLWLLQHGSVHSAVSDNEDAVYLAGYEGGDAYYIDTEGSKRVETDRLKRRVKTLGIDESDNVVVQVLVNVAKGKVDHFRRRFDPTTSTSRFIPNNAVVIVANSSMLREVEEYEHVSWMAHMRSEWKVAQDLKHHVLLLQQKEIAQTPKFSTKLVQIRVILLGGDVSATIAKEWESTWGINFLSYAPGEILFQTSNTNVTEIVEAIQSHENVHWIERVHEKKPMNWMGAKSLQGGPNSSQPLKIWDKGITGKGQKVHVWDNGLDLTHCFFQPSSVPVCERCGRSTYYEQSVSQATALADYWKNKACQSSFWDEYVDQSLTAKQYIHYYLYYYTGNYTIYSFTNAQLTETYCPRFTNIANYSCIIDRETGSDVYAKAFRAMLIDIDSSPGCASNPPWVSRSGQISCSITGTGCDTLATDQRKVQAYLLNTDAKDYKSHGTHVSGSVAGYAANANASINRFKGQAYEADLIFSSGFNYIPQVSPYFQWAHNLGVYIHTNSWGDSLFSYNTGSADIDNFMHTNEDSLVLFAAGNGGLNGDRSLGTQACSKNSLVVGAASQPSAYNIDVGVQEASRRARYTIWTRICSAQALTANNNDLLTAINAVVSAQCSQTFASAADVVSYYCDGNKIDNDATYQQWACLALDVSSGVGCKDYALTFLERQKFDVPFSFNDACGNVNRAEITDGTKNGIIGDDVMADFSSRGPAPDNRIKPDVVAPGNYVVSSLGDDNVNSYQCTDQCANPTLGAGLHPGLARDAGTSMATPLTAGSIALIRQYYTEGWHVNGVKDVSNGITPSSALLKATAIASTIPVRGNVSVVIGGQRTYRPVTSSADYVYHTGFGHVRLASILSFAGDSFKIHVVDKKNISSGGSQCYRVSTPSPSSSMFEVASTLVWIDPPATPSASKQLVNDLDLTLLNHSHSVKGNEKVLQRLGRDSTNNVEKAWLGGTEIEIRIDAQALNVGSAQKYALVTLAPSAVTIAPSPCSLTAAPTVQAPSSSPTSSPATAAPNFISNCTSILSISPNQTVYRGLPQNNIKCRFLVPNVFKIEFSLFYLENNYDFLYVYPYGADINFPLPSATKLTGDLTASKRTFAAGFDGMAMYYTTDYSASYPGFRFKVLPMDCANTYTSERVGGNMYYNSSFRAGINCNFTIMAEELFVTYINLPVANRLWITNGTKAFYFDGTSIAAPHLNSTSGSFEVYWSTDDALSHPYGWRFYTPDITTKSPTITRNPTVSPSTVTPTTHPVTTSPTTQTPTVSPSTSPTMTPTTHPVTTSPTTQTPTVSPSTMTPTTHPVTKSPTITRNPTVSPSTSPTMTPTTHPVTKSPTTNIPTVSPSTSPSMSPTITKTLYVSAEISSNLNCGDNTTSLIWNTRVELASSAGRDMESVTVASMCGRESRAPVPLSQEEGGGDGHVTEQHQKEVHTLAQQVVLQYRVFFESQSSAQSYVTQAADLSSIFSASYRSTYQPAIVVAAVMAQITDSPTTQAPLISSSSSSSSSNSSNLGSIVGGVLGAVAAIAIIGGLFYYCRMNKMKQKSKEPIILGRASVNESAAGLGTFGASQPRLTADTAIIARDANQVPGQPPLPIMAHPDDQNFDRLRLERKGETVVV